MFSSSVTKAFSLAAELHKEQKRKSSGVPYVTHVMAVAALVGEYGGGEEQIIAALLHDAVEDQGGLQTLERIQQCFGKRVSELVLACSDTYEDPKPPWRQRKERHLAAMRTADFEVRLILAADKLHNTRSLIRGVVQEGDTIWRHFKWGKEGALWYLFQAREALREGWDHPILREWDGALEELCRITGTNPASFSQLPAE